MTQGSLLISASGQITFNCPHCGKKVVLTAPEIVGYIAADKDK